MRDSLKNLVFIDIWENTFSVSHDNVHFPRLYLKAKTNEDIDYSLEFLLTPKEIKKLISSLTTLLLS